MAAAGAQTRCLAGYPSRCWVTHVAGYDRVMPVINDSMFRVLLLVMAICVLVMVLEIYRVVRGDHALLRTRA